MHAARIWSPDFNQLIFIYPNLVFQKCWLPQVIPSDLFIGMPTRQDRQTDGGGGGGRGLLLLWLPYRFSFSYGTFLKTSTSYLKESHYWRGREKKQTFIAFNAMVRKPRMNLFSSPCVLSIPFIGFSQSWAVYIQNNTLNRAPSGPWLQPRT